MISRRTKDALAAAKARGIKLGNPRPVAPAQRVRDLASVKAAQHRASIKPLIEKLRNQGLSLAAIAKQLNQSGILTAHGKQWYAATVKNVIQS